MCVLVVVERRRVAEVGGLPIKTERRAEKEGQRRKGLHERDKFRKRKNAVAVDVALVVFMLLLC